MDAGAVRYLWGRAAAVAHPVHRGDLLLLADSPLEHLQPRRPLDDRRSIIDNADVEGCGAIRVTSSVPLRENISVNCALWISGLCA